MRCGGEAGFPLPVGLGVIVVTRGAHAVSRKRAIVVVASATAITWPSDTLGQTLPGLRKIPRDPASGFNWDEPDRFRWVLTSGRDFTTRELPDEETVIYRGNGWSCVISPVEAGRDTWATAQGERYFKEERILLCTATKSGNKVMIEVSCTTSKEARMYMTAEKDLYLGAASTPVDFRAMFWMQLRCNVWIDTPASPDGKVQGHEWRYCHGARSTCEIEEPVERR